MIHLFSFSLGFVIGCVVGSVNALDTIPNPGTPWPATDALGRSLPLFSEVGPPKAGRFVGIFYFLWLGDRYDAGPYDVSKILAADPDALKKGDSPLWGPRGYFHFWGEPLFGYYNTTDPWVLRRHAYLLSDAGVDTLIFDTTNAVTYPAVYGKLCEIFMQIRKEGYHTPQICFMVNTRAGQTARAIYDALYRPGLYRDLWFHWQGKPLMICDPAAADTEVQAFFTLRRAHWPFQQVNTQNAWHWESVYPQVYGYTMDPDVPEQVNVAVAQNLRVDNGDVTNMSAGNARGRSYHHGAMDERAGAVNWGYNVQEQWERALELDPPFVMVTGWNEWVAGRWGEPDGPPVFVDQFDQEYSRDIEPMRGGHGDNYYLQLVANIRRYKGAPPVPESSEPHAISIESGFEPWDKVAPEFIDPVNDTQHRDHVGFGKFYYRDTSGRNDFVQMKVARDDLFVYFYARTRHAITTPNHGPWMALLLDSDQNPKTGWQGYDYVVNQVSPGNHTTWLEQTDHGLAWNRITEISYHVSGNQVHLAIPRSALKLPGQKVALDFKWIDNIPIPTNITDFYLLGDVAPDGRFVFRYQAN
ncbi:MAG: hypothetical protein JW829_10930 [Pirellulales bacterium]|nr:hypothetical protein [Pirellulales bacterium]